MSAKSPRKSARPAAKAAASSPAKRASAKTPRNPTTATVAAKSSKQSRLIELLRSPSGGTIEQLTKLTGWQPHTVRGAISGALRKRLKLNVTCTGSVYRIVEAQA
jgi:Protein of unknown function (DUF3489)